MSETARRSSPSASPEAAEKQNSPDRIAPPRTVSYLKIIAVYKLMKGVLLLTVGVSLLFLGARSEWLNALTTWVHDELASGHNRLTQWILGRLEHFLGSDTLRNTGIFSLIYAVVLFAEGIGVYLEQRWAEVLMVVATAGLVPLEVYHFFHRPTLTKAFIIIANSLIVWYLYRTLKQSEDHHRRKQDTDASEKSPEKSSPKSCQNLS